MSKIESARQYLKFSTAPILAAGAVLLESAGQTPIAIAVAGATVLAVRHLVRTDLPRFEAFQAGRRLGEERGLRVGYSRRMFDNADRATEQKKIK